MNSTLLRISGLALVIVALLASPAVAQSPTTGPDHAHEMPGDEIDDATAFDHMVRGIDVLPSAADMKERFPDVTERLVALALDEEATTYERWRATSLLGNFVEPTSERALKELTDDSEPRVRAMAYYVLGAAFLSDGDDELFALLKGGLEDDEARVRADVVRSLGWTEYDRAAELLDDIASGDDESLQSIAERAMQRRHAD